MTLDEREYFADDLRALLSGPLPGREAQYKMASMRRLEELGVNPPPPDARVACVLNLLHWHQDHWRTVLIERTVNPRDRHSGQVSFPGGRYEEGDGELANVALREAHEEIGVLPAQVQMLGRLTELYIPVSNYVVHPFVGLLLEEPAFMPQPGEVEHILTPALSVFTDSRNKKNKDISIAPGILIKDVPYFEVQNRVVWGATAMIMNEFLHLLEGSRVL